MLPLCVTLLQDGSYAPPAPALGQALTFCPTDDVDALASVDSCLDICGAVESRNNDI